MIGPRETTGTNCADCGAPFPVPPASGGASGYAITAVPRFPHARVRTLMRDGTNLGTEPRTAQPGCSFFPAFYDVEGEQAAHDAKRELPFRRVCYACSAVLESETMTARGRGCLYLSREAHVDGAYFLAGDARRGYAYDYRLSNWPGNAPFRLLGRVRESHGYGFGRRYDVRTLRFVGPDGYVWSGRNAGDMQLARCRRTKDRVRPGTST